MAGVATAVRTAAQKGVAVASETVTFKERADPKNYNPNTRKLEDGGETTYAVPVVVDTVSRNDLGTGLLSSRAGSGDVREGDWKLFVAALDVEAVSLTLDTGLAVELAGQDHDVVAVDPIRVSGEVVGYTVVARR